MVPQILGNPYIENTHGSILEDVPSRKLTWKPKKGPIKATVLLKGGYMGFHVSLGECREH